MKTVLQIEHSATLLSTRRSILLPLGYDVISVIGFTAALYPDLLRQPIGAVVIGHGASRIERQELISHSAKVCPVCQSWHSYEKAISDSGKLITIVPQTIHHFGSELSPKHLPRGKIRYSSGFECPLASQVRIVL